MVEIPTSYCRLPIIQCRWNSPRKSANNTVGNAIQFLVVSRHHGHAIFGFSQWLLLQLLGRALHAWLIWGNWLLMFARGPHDNNLRSVASLGCIIRVYYTPRFNEVERGVYWYHLVRLSVCLSVCPSVDRIVSALYLQQYSSDPFHICTSYQATSEGVSRVMPVAKLKFWRIF